MKKFIGFIIQFILLITFLFPDITESNFPKNLYLKYAMVVDSKVLPDNGRLENPIILKSAYTLHFVIFDRDESGNSLVAATSHFDGITFPDIGKKTESPYAIQVMKLIENWTSGFEKTDITSFVMDTSGTLVKGRMLWPDSIFYYIQDLLGGLIEKERDLDRARASRISIRNKFNGMQTMGDRDYAVYTTSNNMLKAKLLVDQTTSTPYSFEAEYQYSSLGFHFQDRLFIKLAELQEDSQNSWDDTVKAAVIQASMLSGKKFLELNFIHRVLSSPTPKLRIIASAYLASTGELQKPIQDTAQKYKNEIVLFNLAKADYRCRGDKKALEHFFKKGSDEVKARAAQILARENNAFFPGQDILQNARKEMNTITGIQEKEYYRAARELNSKEKSIQHYGPATYMLKSGVSGEKVFHYNVYTPDDYDTQEKYPLLLGLALGNGISEMIFIDTKKALPYQYILVCPDAKYGMWWEPDQIHMLEDLLDTITDKYSIDPDRIYLWGVSNGGTGSYHFTYTHPDRFAAVASLMGYSIFAKKGYGVEVERSLNLKNTPILIMHGDADSEIPITPDRKIADFLKKNRIKHKFIEIAGEGHNLHFSTYQKDILNFFKKKKRNSAPKEINFIVDEIDYNRDFWVEVNQKRNLEERAWVKAEMKDNKYVINTKNVKVLSLLLNDFHYDENLEYEVILNNKSIFRGKLKLDPDILWESLQKTNDYAKIYGVKLTLEAEE